MRKTSQEKVQREEQVVLSEKKPTAEDMLKAVSEVVRENFVATYERTGNSALLIRLVGGQRFRLSIEEVVE